jgi:hypothetical protein
MVLLLTTFECEEAQTIAAHRRGRIDGSDHLVRMGGGSSSTLLAHR